jgi:hypothetical protein
MRRVSVRTTLARTGAIAFLIAAGYSAASAQSMLQWVPGFDASPGRDTSERPVPSLRSLQRWSPYALGTLRSYPQTTPPSAYPAATPPASAGEKLYRTFCVRTCDGYYWPVDNNASRASFHEEAASCAQSCDTEAKLYVLPHGSDDVGLMTDLGGRSYGELGNAFVYRKTLIAGCSCRPMPWNRSERARHAAYAAAAEAERERHELAAQQTSAADVGSSDRRLTTAADEAAVASPPEGPRRLR